MSIDRQAFTQATFRDGELAIVVHTEATHYRMHERRRTAIALTAEDAAKLARELLAALPAESAAEFAREVFGYAESA